MNFCSLFDDESLKVRINSRCDFFFSKPKICSSYFRVTEWFYFCRSLQNLRKLILLFLVSLVLLRFFLLFFLFGAIHLLFIERVYYLYTYYVITRFYKIINFKKSMRIKRNSNLYFVTNEEKACAKNLKDRLNRLC